MNQRKRCKNYVFSLSPKDEENEKKHSCLYTTVNNDSNRNGINVVNGKKQQITP